MASSRIKVLLDHIIDLAKINNEEDIELCAIVLRGSIEKGCTSELADKVEEFTEEQVIRDMMRLN